MGVDERTPEGTPGTEPALLEVGRVGRAHGLGGDVVVKLTSNRVERLEAGARLVIDSSEYTVSSSRPHKSGHLVRFEGVTSREATDPLTGRPLMAEPIVDPGAIWAHEAIGCEVVGSDGTVHGRVEALQENPASDLLVLEDGLLVPVAFVAAPPSDGRIVVDAPEGLFDL